MMERLITRGTELAAAAQQRGCEHLAEKMRRMFGDPAVERGTSTVTVRAQGLAKRWLSDPALRFFGAFR